MNLANGNDIIQTVAVKPASQQVTSVKEEAIREPLRQRVIKLLKSIYIDPYGKGLIGKNLDYQESLLIECL